MCVSPIFSLAPSTFPLVLVLVYLASVLHNRGSFSFRCQLRRKNCNARRLIVSAHKLFKINSIQVRKLKLNSTIDFKECTINIRDHLSMTSHFFLYFETPSSMSALFTSICWQISSNFDTPLQIANFVYGQSLNSIIQGPLNRWTSQLDLGNTTGGLETVVSVHNST